MKKQLLSMLAALCITTSVLPSAAAVRTVPVTVDGVTVIAEAHLENGVTSVPLRTLLDAIGGWNIYWDRSSRAAVAHNDSTTIIAKPGEYEITVDGDTRATTCAVYIENGRTYVPLRVLGNSLGWAVEWDRALGGAAVTTESGDWTEEDLYWLSRVISAESRGESLTGQMAVGNVVLNRMASDKFPNTIKGVVFDRKHGTQFEPVDNGTIYNTPTRSSVAAAKAVLAGQRVVGDCLYFYAPALSDGTWIRKNRLIYTAIGCHRFFL
jgi:N-acetylmuramoyl-L-alanine amidase